MIWLLRRQGRKRKLKPSFRSRLSANRLFKNLPSHRKYQRRFLPVVSITETERQRLWRARGIILAQIWLVEPFEQIDWSDISTEEPESPILRAKVAERNARVVLKDRRANP